MHSIIVVAVKAIIVYSPFFDLAGVVGIEPTSFGLESNVLPLNYTPIKNTQ